MVDESIVPATQFIMSKIVRFLESIIHPTQGVSKTIKSNEGFDPVYDLCSVAQRNLKIEQTAEKNYSIQRLFPHGGTFDPIFYQISN